MTGSGQIFQFIVIFRSCIRIFNDGADGCTTGFPFKQPGNHTGQIRFFSGGGIGISAGSSALHKFLHRIQIDLFAHGQTINDYTNGFRVGLSKNGDLHFFTKIRCHPLHLPISSIQ